MTVAAVAAAAAAIGPPISALKQGTWCALSLSRAREHYDESNIHFISTITHTLARDFNVEIYFYLDGFNWIAGDITTHDAHTTTTTHNLAAEFGEWQHFILTRGGFFFSLSFDQILNWIGWFHFFLFLSMLIYRITRYSQQSATKPIMFTSKWKRRSILSTWQQ